MNRLATSCSDQPAQSAGLMLAPRVRIAKIVLSLLAAFSAVFGYLLASSADLSSAVAVFLAVFLLASGAASLNSLQERRADRLLLRTRGRPMVQGLLPERDALLQAQLLMAAGFLVLFAVSGTVASPAAAAVAVLLYNFLYTPLKLVSLWAFLPGTISGALPPVIGWLAAGGPADSPIMLTTAVLLGLWQLPHFWLVLLMHKEDYLACRQPHFLTWFSEHSLGAVLRVWVVALITVTHLLLVVPVILPEAIRWLVSLASFITLGVFGWPGLWRKQPPYRLLFLLLNGYLFLVMLLISIGRIIG